MSRESERAKKLAQKPTKSPFVQADEQAARQRARDKRDEAVNNERTRTEHPERTTHIPTPAKGRKEIEEEITDSDGRPLKKKR